MLFRMQFFNALIAISFLLSGSNAEQPVLPTECEMSPDDRKECGWPGIAEETCAAKECCYDESIKGGEAHWCFYEIGDDRAELCAMSADDRKECGWPGISVETCTAKNCCYDESIKGGEAHWCFYEIGDDRAEKCAVPGDQRKECGWPGIDVVTCMNRGCCYDESIKGGEAHWCFYEKSE